MPLQTDEAAAVVVLVVVAMTVTSAVTDGRGARDHLGRQVGVQVMGAVRAVPAAQGRARRGARESSEGAQQQPQQQQGRQQQRAEALEVHFHPTNDSTYDETGEGALQGPSHQVLIPNQ